MPLPTVETCLKHAVELNRVRVCEKQFVNTDILPILCYKNFRANEGLMVFCRNMWCIQIDKAINNLIRFSLLCGHRLLLRVMQRLFVTVHWQLYISAMLRHRQDVCVCIEKKLGS